MKLPYRKNVYIPKEKLTAYLLSQTHAVGRFKSKYFHALGYGELNVSLFEKDFRTIAQSQDVKEVLSTPYGKKYIIDGKIETPSGKVVKLRTVWIIEEEQKRPRFITVYPV